MGNPRFDLDHFLKGDRPKLLTKDEARRIADNIAKLRVAAAEGLIERTARNDKGPANCGNLFDLFFQGGASSWIHMMDLMAYRTGHRLINVAVLGGVFGGEALNAVSSLGAAVHEERHAID